MRQNIFSFKEFSWGKLMDLMTLPTSVGNKKGPRAWTLLTKAEGGRNRKPVFTTSLSQPPPWPPRCRAESWLRLTLRQAAGRAAALGPPAHGTRSSEGHIRACSQIPALLWGHFSHLVAVFHKSVAVCLPALPCTAPPSTVSPDAKHSEWHQETDPSQDRHGEKLCFLSCQACKTSVTRGCAGQMGFPFFLKRWDLHPKWRPSAGYSLQSAGYKPSCKQHGSCMQPALSLGNMYNLGSWLWRDKGKLA